MKQPSLEEVKEYFKNVKEVIPVGDTKKVNITKKIEEDIHEWNGHFWIDLDYSVYKGISVLLWDADGYEYAKILTYKEKTFSITESQIKKAHNAGFIHIEKWFPEAFESEVKLEVGKWYKSWNGVLKFWVTNDSCYGFNSEGVWSDIKNGDFDLNGTIKIYKWKEATEQEVFEALKNEAVKRGYKEGVCLKTFISDFYIMSYSKIEKSKEYYNCEEGKFDKNALRMGGCCIYSNGKWAEIIQTITKEAAEKLLNKKIV